MYGLPLHTDVGIDTVGASPSTIESDDGSYGEPDAKRGETSGYRHWLSEKTAGDAKGCAQKGMGDIWRAETQGTRAYHERQSKNVRAAIDAGGRGYRPTPLNIKAMTKHKTEKEKI